MKSIVRFLICLWLLTISFGVSSALAVDKALFLDGSEDYVEIVDSPTLNNLKSRVTVEAWIRANGYSGEWMSIIYKGDKCCEGDWAHRSLGWFIFRGS